MQKKLTAMTLALLLMLSVTANALSVEPRYNVTASCVPTMTFTGTTANCKADIRAQRGSAISGTLTLYHVVNGKEVEVTHWSLSGTTNLSTTKTSSVTKGETYKLTISVTVNGPGGRDNITQSTTKKCG